MKIFCTGNKSKKNFKKVLLNIKSIVEADKSEFYLDVNKSYSNISCKVLSFSEISVKNIDLVISIGGDGSLLASIQKMNINQIPVLGIHIGNLGFLNQLDLSNYEYFLPKIISSTIINYDENYLISANVFNSNNVLEYSFIGFNDIVINHGKLLKLINAELFLNDIYLNSYTCDGLIFSTALGSTAYSLSAGGPILSPDIEGIIITPISSHSLSSRSIVISNDDTIRVEFTSKTNKNINVVSDGQNYKKIDNTFKVFIKKSNIKSKLLKIENVDDYYSKLRNIIGW